MKIRIIGLLAGVAAVAASSFVSCTQPAIDCRVAVSSFSGYGYIATYKLKDSTGTCPDQPGDTIGMESYNQPKQDGEFTNRDQSKTTVAIQTDYMSSLSPEPDAVSKAYSLGDFDATEPVDDFCTVPTTTVGEQHPEDSRCDPAGCLDCATDADCVIEEEVAPAYPVCDATTSRCIRSCTTDADCVEGSGTRCDAGACILPKTDVTSQWSNVKVYVTAAAQGTQFSADLKFTQDDCDATYEVIGMWPAIDCADYDEDGNPTGPNDSYCCPDADPAGGRPYGSGINPDFPVKCDPVLLTCVLDMSKSKDGKLPVLLEDWSKDEKYAPQCKPTVAATE